MAGVLQTEVSKQANNVARVVRLAWRLVRWEPLHEHENGEGEYTRMDHTVEADLPNWIVKAPLPEHCVWPGMAGVVNCTN